MLVNLEKIVHESNWIFGEDINKLDISILPFIRQFRIADPNGLILKKGLRNYRMY